MFHTFTFLELQIYLYVVIAIIGATLVFMLYVQGGQALAMLFTRNEEEKTAILNSVGKRYEITFTTLVTFGGSFFAIFPKFYSVSFGGATFVWFLILFLFVIEGVSFKYRHKVSNLLGARTYEIFLLLNGIGAPLLLAAAVATFFTGANFEVHVTNIANFGDITVGAQAVTEWTSPWRGLEALWNPVQNGWLTNLSFAIAIVLLMIILAILNTIKNVQMDDLILRLRKLLLPLTGAFLVCFLIFLYKILTISGFGYDPISHVVSLVPYKYLTNFLAMPWVLGAFLIGVLSVVASIALGYFVAYRRAFWLGGFGTFLVALSLILVAGLNNTVFYPSLSHLQDSLTIENASSSYYTLVVIAYATFLMPIVLAYVAYVWNSIRADGFSQKYVKNNLSDLY